MSSRPKLVQRLAFRDPRGYEYAAIHLDALTPDPGNPRIPLQPSSLECILAIERNDSEGLLSLAKKLIDLSGSNPAELLSVSELTPNNFIVKEGNRRVAARKILRNPEILRTHVSDPIFRRWVALSKTPAASSLPLEILSVIGADHEAWIDLRHLGPQGGAGLQGWDPESKRRRDQRRGGQDIALSFLDRLKQSRPERFEPLAPPKGRFTTFARLLESQEGREQLGITRTADGVFHLRYGERSLRMLEEILKDLRRDRDDSNRLTSRTIHSTDNIATYLGRVEARVGDVPPDRESVRLDGAGPATRSTPTSAGTTPKPAKKLPDVMRAMPSPQHRGLRAVFDELKTVRRRELPIASMVLTRLLVELATDLYASKHQLSFAADVDNELKQLVEQHIAACHRAGVTVERRVSEVLRAASRKGMQLSEKLDKTIEHLGTSGAMVKKEADAKRREIKTTDVLPLLNDAVHRLNTRPSEQRVTHILEVLLPVYSAMGPL